MQSKTSSKWSSIVLGTTGIVFLGTIVFFLTFVSHSQGSYYIDQPSLTNNQTQQSSNVGFSYPKEPSGSIKLPIRLTISKINVDAAVEDVGLTAQMAMAVPEGPTDVAWFDLGPRPGENGSAVIAGHEGWKNGIRAIFDDLYKLRTGDKVYVKDAQGTTTTFVVRAVRIYSQNENALDVFSSNDGKAHLNLITCEGTWNVVQKSYSNRLVVFTDKEIK